MWSDTATVIALSPEFWATSEAIDALVQRDTAGIFRLVQRETRVTQSRLGVAVGLSQAQVSEVMSGARKIVSIDVFARIAQDLNIPASARSMLFLGSKAPVATEPSIESEVVAVYAMRGLVSRPTWNDLISGATKQLWLYGMAELGYALDDEVPDIIESAAQKGCDIRVLLLDPEYDQAGRIDAEEGSPVGTLNTRTRAALARYRLMQVANEPAVQIRIFDAPPSVGIVRGDNHMLVTPYLRFVVGSNSPTLELRRMNGKIFDRYVRHFQKTWDEAKEWTP